MKSSHLLAVTLALTTLSATSFAADAPIAKLCHESEDSYPWILKDRPGMTTTLLKIAEKNLGGKLEIVGIPWKRCTEEVKSGAMDGAIKISYAADRAEWIAYPMAGDKPDASKRLLIDTYSLYRLKGSTTASWDGKTLKADGPVGAQSGFSIVKFLQEKGAKVDDGTKSADDNIRKLIEGRIVAVALQTEEGDTSMAAKKDYAPKVEKLTPVLVEKPYFVAFSKQFYGKDQAKAKKIWDAIEKARESAEYKDFVKKFK